MSERADPDDVTINRERYALALKLTAEFAIAVLLVEDPPTEEQVTRRDEARDRLIKAIARVE